MELNYKGSELYQGVMNEEETFSYKLWIYARIKDVVMTPRKGVN